MPRHRIIPAVAACAAAAMALLAAPAAQADSANWNKTLADDALGPFNLAVNHNKVYVADGFKNTVGILGRAPFGFGPEGGDVAGIDVTADGKTVAWTWSTADHSDTGLTIRTRGKADVVAHLAAVEAAKNPDSVKTYGIVAGGNACAEQILGQLTGGPATYRGMVDSHPYSVARVGHRWVVADAGSNALWSVTDKGAVSTLSVLPPQPVTLTADMVAGLAEGAGAPPEALACLVGVTYAFEAVPTDVEVGPDGSLWVSVLPGGPEDPSLGARGAVYKVNAATGAATRVAGGFLGATNLAVASDGTVYVTELFGGKISKISRNGAVSTAATIARPLSVEVHGGYLYVGQFADLDFETGQVNAPGSIVRLKR
jgi:hypothetical protein